jgi:hypothetical protein
VNKKLITALGGAGGLVVASAIALANATPFNPLSEETAKKTCREAVKSALKAPSTAEFQAGSARVFQGIGHLTAEVELSVDAENSFGADIRSSFKCEMYDKDKAWKVTHVYRVS